ncbi:SMP-30/gluconolactonase/LRE family protein [Myxococcota bacterium]|nr:SMP-30/gluconolactonase/LRE family protein [Myxococcota bacterium]
MTSEIKPELVVDARADLGECPVWCDKTRRLWWIDIERRELHRHDPGTGANERWELPALVGAVAPREAGGLLMAIQNGFASFDPDTGEFVVLAEVELPGPTSRMNDGKCDPAGRMFAGTLATRETGALGALHRLDLDGSVHRLVTGIQASNGLGWSPSGDRLYYVDSATFRIDVFDFDVATGDLSDRRSWVELPSDDPRVGLPDGLTMDAEGGVWVALYGAGRVERYGPDARLDAVIEFSVPTVTCPTFGGDDLGDLYVTSLATDPWTRAPVDAVGAGGLFRCRPGVAGMPVDRFRG